MNKTTTQEELLRYAYNESALNDSDRIQRSIDGDPLIQQDFNEIVGVLQSMDHLLLEPSAKSIELILAFANKHEA